jgi:hypothetical protein
MKKALLITLFSAIFTAIAFFCHAQITPGPSDITTSAPTSAASVGKVICIGAPISITAIDSGINTFQWYKINTAGTAVLSTITGATYTETSTTPGYYNYEVVASNGTGCISPVSSTFKVYVLPALSVNITSPFTSVCSVVGNSVLLTVNVPSSAFIYTYQWTNNGTAISGATGPTYNITNQTTPGNITFGCNVAYLLNPACISSATKVITVVSAPNTPTLQ